MGVAPFNMPVTDDDTCCSANGNSDSGMAIQMRPSTATRRRSTRSMRPLRAAGNMARVRKPKRMRIGVMSAAGNASSPSAMKKNDVPHTRPGTAQRAQSTAVM